MKKTICFLLCSLLLFCACSADETADSSESGTTKDYESVIASLESEIASLKAGTERVVQFADKGGYLAGVYNPQVSLAISVREEVDKNIPPAIYIQGVEYSTELTSLTISSKKLTNADIEPLKYMVNLTELHLYSNDITDLTPLQGLTELKTLSLFRNKIVDLTPIGGLAALENLYVRNNQITDISTIAGLENLKNLDISENQIKDLYPVSGMHDLGMLWANDNPISDLAPLAQLENLTRLHIQNCNITNLAPISGLTKIVELYAENNQIEDVTPLSGFLSMQFMKLSDNPIEDLTPLENMSNLKKAYIQNTNADPEQIEKLREALLSAEFVTD
jgi:Leucine-rich repeat (LRR) protein